jgi:hypothetical protein
MLGVVVLVSVFLPVSVLDIVGVSVCVRDAELLEGRDKDSDWVPRVADLVRDMESVSEADIVSVTDAEDDSVGDQEAVTDAVIVLDSVLVCVEVALTVKELENVGDGEIVDVVVIVRDALKLFELVLDTVVDHVAVFDLVAEPVSVVATEKVNERVPEAVLVTEFVKVLLSVWLRVSVPLVLVAVKVCDAVLDVVAEKDSEVVAVAVCEPDVEALDVMVADSVTELVHVRVEVPDCVLDAVRLGDKVEVRVAVVDTGAVRDPLKDWVGVPDVVLVVEKLALALKVKVPLCVEVRVEL